MKTFKGGFRCSHFAGLILAVSLALLMPVWGTQAQGEPQIQEFSGSIDKAHEGFYYDLFGLRAGQTLYLYAETTSGDLDPYLYVGDLEFTDIYAEDDDSGGNLNPALEFPIPQDGDYSVYVTGIPGTAGDYRLLVGLDAPEVLTRTAQPSGEAFAFLYVEPKIQEFTGALVEDAESEQGTYYDLFGLRAGQTLYVYVEALSEDLDPYLFVGNIDFTEVYAEDGDSGGDLNAALEFPIPTDGDYSLYVTHIEGTSGDFRLLVGLDAPDVLTGEGEPTGDEIAVVYEQPQGPVVGRLPQVQEITGTMAADSPENEAGVYYDLYGLVAGQTLYLYAAATSGDLDPYLYIGNLDFSEVYVEDDDSGGGLNSALEFLIPEDGDYSLYITHIEGTSGDFRLLVGLDAPEVLAGTALPTGHEIAVLYVGSGGGGEPPEVEITDCSVLAERPHFDGLEQTRETENFVIHYTEQGGDGVTPAYVDEVERVMEAVYDKEINEMSWPAPPLDCGEGGDRRFDVYLMDTIKDPGVYGYADPQGMVGDNPATAKAEAYAAYGYLVFDNDFAGDPTPIPTMRATAAHEFHHVVQFGYDINDAVGWYYEATASWMETQTFPVDEAASPYVSTLLESPDLCLGADPEDSVLIYADWILLDSLAQDYGPGVIQSLWEVVADEEGMAAFYSLLDKLGTTPQAVMERFAVRNLLLEYSLSKRFQAQVSLENRISGVGKWTPTFSGVQELGVDYLELALRGTYRFSIDRPNLALVVVGIDQPNAQARVFELGPSGIVDTSSFTHAYLLVLNTDTHADPASCTTTDWQVAVSDAAGETPTPPLDKVFDASRFVAPK